MKSIKFFAIAIVGTIIFFSACERDSSAILEPESEPSSSVIENELEPLPGHMGMRTHKSNYIHGIVIKLDREDYYFAGAPDDPNGEFDVPGHDWKQVNSRIKKSV